MRSSNLQESIELSDEDENLELFIDTASTSSTTPLSSAGRKRKHSLKSPKAEADEDLKKAIINVLNKSMADEGDKVDDYCKFLAKEMKTLNDHQFFLARQRIDQVISE